MKSTFSIIASAARAALQWRLLLLWAALLLIPTLFAALPVWRLLANNLDHSVHAGRLAQALDLVAIADLRDAAGKQRPLLTYAGALSLLVTLLLSPLLTGMAVAAARLDHVAGWRALWLGGWNEYGRMLRMLLWGCVLLLVALYLGDLATSVAARRAHLALVEAEANWAYGVGAGVAVLLLLLVQASLDAGRAWMALDTTRTGEVGSWWRGTRALLRRLPSTLTAYAVMTVFGLVLATLLVLLRAQVSASDTMGLIVGALLVQASVMVLAWMRIARLYAFMQLAQRA